MRNFLHFLLLFLTDLGRATTGRKPIPDPPKIKKD